MKTEALLKKYLESGLNEDERFLLEKRALDDDLLADAWEGLQLYGSPEKVKNWNALQDRWKAEHSQKKKTRIIPLRRWAPLAVAASVLILAGTFFWLNPAQKQLDPSGPVALEVDLSDERAQTNYESQKEAEIQEAVESTSDIRNIVRQEEAPQLVANTTQPKQYPEPVAVENREKPTPSISFNQNPAKEEATSINGLVEADITANDVVDETDISIPVDIASNQASDQGVVLLKTQAEDAEGDSFVAEEIALEEVALDEAVAAPTEYQKIESTPRANALSLNDDSILSKKARTFQPNSISQNSRNGSPDIGWEAFISIIRENGLRTDEAFMIGLKPPLQVVVRFILDENRIPKNIQIMRGANPKNLVEKILSESGTWTIENTEEPIQVEFVIPLIGLKD